MEIKQLLPEPLRAVLRKSRDGYRTRRGLQAWAMSYYSPQLALIEEWLKAPNEITNFTYDITDASKLYLAFFVSELTGVDALQARAYIAEIDEDDDLRNHVRKRTLAVNPDYADTTQSVGRRMGWYAMARALRPKVVVETGVEKGLGSCVLAQALLRNRADGFPGTYFGTDINPSAGYLFTPPYSEAGTILYGDSIASLKTLSEPIDLFINDSDHSADYEAQEYETVGPLLSPNAFVLGDNAHVTTKLAEFARKTGRSFLFWPEKPKNHWYPGCGIGVAYSRKT